MEEYLKQILRYLPIQFADEESNEFVKYLGEAYTENIEKGKYQFAFTAFHMLNMIFVYKAKWFLKEQGNQEIIDSLNNQRSMTFGALFDLSQISEKTSLEKLLKSLNFHVNDIGISKNHVEVRNNCSHASGRIYYKTQSKIEHYIVEEIEFIEKTHSRLKNELKKFLLKILEEKWSQTFFSEDFNVLFEETHFSLKDLETISKLDLPLFRKKSNNEKYLKQKTLYLLLIFEIQNQIESDKNLFLEKLPMIVNDLPEKIGVEKDGDIAKVYTSEIIEEFLIPIIGNFPDEERKKAEKILSF